MNSYLPLVEASSKIEFDWAMYWEDMLKTENPSSPFYEENQKYYTRRMNDCLRKSCQLEKEGK